QQGFLGDDGMPRSRAEDLNGFALVMVVCGACRFIKAQYATTTVLVAIVPADNATARHVGKIAATLPRYNVGTVVGGRIFDIEFVSVRKRGFIAAFDLADFDHRVGFF